MERHPTYFCTTHARLVAAAAVGPLSIEPSRAKIWRVIIIWTRGKWLLLLLLRLTWAARGKKRRKGNKFSEACLAKSSNSSQVESECVFVCVSLSKGFRKINSLVSHDDHDEDKWRRRR